MFWFFCYNLKNAKFSFIVFSFSASLPTPKTPTKRHRVPVRNSQLLQKIQEARTEIANHQNRPESSLLLPVTVLNQMDILNVNLNQCVHEILTNSCSSDLDPVKAS